LEDQKKKGPPVWPVAWVALGLFSVCISACATVREEDQNVWVGQPVYALETQPVFLTMQVVKTHASDGTEIRNYVNGKSVSACSNGGSIFSGYINIASYSSFSSCVRSFPSCNNIFYIKNGVVTSYTPVGTGGGRCFTDSRTHPYFRGATNL